MQKRYRGLGRGGWRGRGQKGVGWGAWWGVFETVSESVFPCVHPWACASDVSASWGSLSAVPLSSPWARLCFQDSAVPSACLWKSLFYVRRGFVRWIRPRRLRWAEPEGARAPHPPVLITGQTAGPCTYLSARGTVSVPHPALRVGFNIAPSPGRPQSAQIPVCADECEVWLTNAAQPAPGLFQNVIIWY